MPGQWLKDRIDEWHRHNPGHITTQMIYDLLLNDEPKTSLTYSVHSLNEPLTTMQLSTQDHIESLEKELFQLRTRQVEPLIDINVNRETQAKKTRMVPEVVIPRVRKPNVTPKPLEPGSQPDKIANEPPNNANEPA